MAPTNDLSAAVDYYELLAIPSNASESDIRRAYRKTSLLYHPDKVKSTPETVEKFQVLQVALAVLTDSVEKSKYDQSREAKLRRRAENEALEDRRRRMKEDLENQENAPNGGIAPINGIKRAWSERELEINRIKEENKRKKQAMMRERQQRSEQVVFPPPSAQNSESVEPSQRSIRVRWLKEGDGLDVDYEWLKSEFARYGVVESVIILKERKKKMEGREKRAVFGTALVIFATLVGAENANASSNLGPLESIEWAGSKADETT